MLPELLGVETESDLFANWVSTQELLERWQAYAMDFLEPLANYSPP